MERNLFVRIRASLQEKRDNLQVWLQAASPEVRQVWLGPEPEVALQTQIQQLDTTIGHTFTETLGVCELCHDYVEPELLEMDYAACVCLSHLSSEERRELETDLELAQSVQKTLMPQQAPTIPGLEIAAFSRPAQIIGGDYFDFYQFLGGKPGLAIADVAGHGMSASLHMASVQTLLRTLTPEHKSPDDVVRKVHQLYNHNIRFTTFVTLFLGVYDQTAQVFTYCNAGHNPAFVFRGSGSGSQQISWLPPTGPAIGLIEEAKYSAESTPLEPGDILVLYTDGITEAVNSQDTDFGRERLSRLVGQASQLSARELVQDVRGGLEAYIGSRSLDDDATLVVCKAVL